MRRAVTAVCLSLCLAASCHIASGLSELEIESGEGGGGGGSAGSGPGGGAACDITVDDMCDLLCDAEQELGCDPALCNLPDPCAQLLLVDAYPWCEAELLAVGCCYLEQAPEDTFYCGPAGDGGDVITPVPGRCPQQGRDWKECIHEGDNPDLALDCQTACSEGFDGASLCLDPMGCLDQCFALTAPTADCSGAWAGLAHCAAKYPDANWTCDDFLGLMFPSPGAGNPCIYPYAEVYDCVSGPPPQP